jgi:type II pantothenate kinase
MSIIGIDLGSTLIKIINSDKKGNLIHKMILLENDYVKAFNMFVSSNNIDINAIDKVILTGIGISRVKEKEISGIEIELEDEFLSTAKGALVLSKKKETIIASMGTGTAFVRVQGNDIKHLGGTGVGGGTILSLCDRFLETNSFEEIVELASKGDLSRVDLRIGDITTSEIETLPKDLTACNFGKLEAKANNSDIALGVINMVFEVVGMMAVFVSKNDNIKDVVVIGSLTVMEQGKRVFEMLGKLFRTKLLYPSKCRIRNSNWSSK